MTTIYTIGFTGKSAEEFFTILKNAGVKRVIDVRLYPSTQLFGFARKKDLSFFLKSLCDIGYQHNPELAPTDEILKSYKDGKISWQEYEVEYLKLLDERNVAANTKAELLDKACFLCAEKTPEQCHRRLLAEHLQAKLGNIEIKHL
ncbi:MAG: DUF488 domain-containing protein [Lactobacillaceae bacterium]|jgi:uncharacterized protein (DUF488 family)|nr:DUF488 domain-containing protein [Lactobacillaceae bacterium]